MERDGIEGSHDETKQTELTQTEHTEPTIEEEDKNNTDTRVSSRFTSPLNVCSVSRNR